ncbi:hypothetical protein ACWGNM_41725 [Streptomyces sp. NPDC055796]
MQRAVGAAALALATCIGAVCAVPTAVAAAAPAPGGEATVASPPSAFAPYLILRAAGTGMLMSDRYDKEPTSWRSADGRRIPSDCGAGQARLGDEVACTVGKELKIRNYASGATESVPARENRAWSTAISPTQVLASEKDADGHWLLHLLGRANEPRKDVPVTGVGAMSSYAVLDSDARGALVEYWGAGAEGKHRHGVLDYATATMKELPEAPGGGSTYNHVGLGSKWIAMVQFDKAVMVSRTDPAVVRTVAIDKYPGRVLAVGDWLIADSGDASDPVVKAYPSDGSAPRPVLDQLDGPLVLGADGSAYGLSTVNGSSRWAVHRISVDAQGALRVQEALAVPARPADRRSIAIAQGDLSALHVDSTESVLGYRTSVSGPPSITQAPLWRCDRSKTDPFCPEAASRFGGTAATGDGRIVGMSAANGCSSRCAVTVHIRDGRTGGAHRTVKLPGELSHARIVSASGRYLLVSAEVNDVAGALVLDIDAGKVLDIKPTSAAGLWGSLLWQPEGDKGVVAATDLRTGQVVRRVDLQSGCRPYEFRANGDWFYSTCSADGAGAAAYQAQTGRRIPLPFVAERPLGPLALGDGYVVHENYGVVSVYNLRSGALVREHQASGYPGNNITDWAVDRFGGRLAYLDQEETLHVVGVTGAASPLAVIDQNVPGTLDAKTAGSRQARWWLSKPVSSWKLMARNKTSGVTTVVRTGGETRGVVDLTWDGKDQTGRAVLNGAYEWTLLATPADGQGAPLKATGSVTLTGATFAAGRGRP